MAVVATAAGDIPLPLHGTDRRQAVLFAADAPVGPVRLDAVEPEVFAAVDARVVAAAPWASLAPDWRIGPLRLPARQTPVAWRGAMRLPGWDDRIAVTAAEAVDVAGTLLSTGVVGVLELTLSPPLEAGRWRVAGVFRDESGGPALVAPRLLRPGAVNPMDALAVLTRERGARYVGDFRLAAPATRLLLRPREEAGAVDVRDLSFRRVGPVGVVARTLRRGGAGLLSSVRAPGAGGGADARARPPGAASPVPRQPHRTGSMPAVSIVTATRDAPHHLERFLRTLRLTDYPAHDLTLVDNGTADPSALDLLAAAQRDGARILRDGRRFNFSALSNAGARSAAGDILVFANNDIAFIDPGWLLHLVAALGEPGVGIAGARLLYDDGRVQHAGLVVAGEARLRHAERFLSGHARGYRNRQRDTTRVSAVTGALLAIHAPLFRALGGFDPALGVLLNDADLCLRAADAGSVSVLVPAATAVHHESASIGPRRTHDLLARGGPLWAFERAEEARLFRARWGKRLDADPCYPADFDPVAADFRTPL